MTAAGRAFWTLVFSLFLAGITPPAIWAADWPPISPEDLSMTALKEQPGAPAVVLLREETEDDLNNAHSVYMRIKVLTEAGRKYADVEIPYSRRRFTIGDVSGRTVHPDGAIVPFEGKVFDKLLLKDRVGQKQQHYQVKSFTLPDVQVGSILDFRYSRRYDDHSLYAANWDVQDDLFQKSASFKFLPYQGEVVMAHDRIGQGIAWTSFLPDGSKPQLHELPRVSFANKHTVSEFVDLQMANVHPIVREPFMPPIEALRYRVNFYYMVGAKQEEFWKDEGKFWNKDVEHFLGRRDGLEQAVTQAVAPTDTPEQKVRKIYALVSAMENQSYNPHREEKELQTLGIKVDRGAEDVLRQRSGDHDQLNRLFAAMVRAAGIPAWMMWVPSREERVFEPSLLTTGQFDAELVIVELGGKDVFLDPGTKFCPYGLMDWRYSNNRGLRQRENGKTEFGESPIPSYAQAMIQRLARLQLTDEGKAEGTVKVGFYGMEAMERRQEGGKTDLEGRKKLLEDEIKSWLPGDSEVHLLGTPNWEDTEKHLVADFQIASPLAVSSGKRWIVPVHVFQVNDRARFPASERVNSVYFDYLWRHLDEVHLALPASLAMESLPPAEDVKQNYAVYSVDQKQEGDHAIVARRDLTMGGIVFPQEMYGEIKGFFDKVKAGDDQQAILKAGANAEPK